MGNSGDYFLASFAEPRALKNFVVAGAGNAPAPTGYEPVEVLFLQPAIIETSDIIRFLLRKAMIWAIVSARRMSA